MAPNPHEEEAGTAMSRALLVVLVAVAAAACNGAATVGDTITERFDDARLEIELVEVHDPAELVPEDDHAPHSDARLIAVELRLRNVSDTAYQGGVRPGPATRAITSGRTEYRHAVHGLQQVSVIECEALSGLTLASGETHTGCVVVGRVTGEEGGQLETFQLMLEGEGRRPLRWQLDG